MFFLLLSFPFTVTLFGLSKDAIAFIGTLLIVLHSLPSILTLFQVLPKISCFQKGAVGAMLNVLLLATLLKLSKTLNATIFKLPKTNFLGKL